MKYKAILFDMDGTLVPMDMKVFTNGYFQDLGKKLEKYNIGQEKLVSAIWAGTGAMVKNDGSRYNKDAFWETFEALTGKGAAEVDADCIDFYGNEFKKAKRFTQDNPLAAEAVKAARSKADKVILATNPLFPMVGQETRLAWVDLKPSDFDFVTAYETDKYCKPNPMYFTALCERMGLDPGECLMIGNDENEDMHAASSVGMDCYLVTDTMIKSEKHPWNGPKGTFKEMVEMLNDL
ncbi:MAG: HAD family hydrolase [Lachnospiraceae bacterium]|nr:HAD family hydrolase [Lachnospiraceae bacterium]